MELFTPQRSQFFRPLVSKHRELIILCLKAFYDRLYSPDNNYGFHVSRGELRELFAEMIRDFTFQESETALELESDEDALDTSDEYTLASSVVRLLMKHGWLEEYLDKATMANAYRFSRPAKVVTKSFIELEQRTIRTKQRNVRNTRNALLAFFEQGDPFDLADAHAYSLQIIEDLSDEIADLDDRKSRMLRSAASGGTIAEFLDYMENHFKPELAVKLAADSVERHRRVIIDIIDKIRSWSPEQLEAVDKKLRPMIPPKMDIASGESPTHSLASSIEQAIDTAYHSKLSELRASLSGFSRAATQLIRQQVSMRQGLGEQLISRVVHKLSSVDDEQQDALLEQIGASINLTSAGLVDPASFHLRKQHERPELATLSKNREPSRDERMQILMQQAESSAFTISPLMIRDFLLAMVGEQGIKLSALSPNDPPSILTIMHAIEAASSSLQGKGECLEVIPLNETFDTPYMTADDFLIRKVS